MKASVLNQTACVTELYQATHVHQWLGGSAYWIKSSYGSAQLLGYNKNITSPYKTTNFLSIKGIEQLQIKIGFSEKEPVTC